MGYKEFLEMKKDANDFEGNKIVPSTVVHQMWRQHILDTHNYDQDCRILVGQRVEYPATENPALDSKTKNKRIAGTKSRLCQRKKCELVELDEEIWGFERPPMVQLPVGASSIKAKEAKSAGVMITIHWDGESEKKNNSEFKVVETMKLSRIFQAYAKQRGVNRKSLTFLLRSSSREVDENGGDERILLHDENGKPTHQPLEGTETPLKLFSGNDTINGRQLWIDCEPRRCEC